MLGTVVDLINLESRIFQSTPPELELIQWINIGDERSGILLSEHLSLRLRH